MGNLDYWVMTWDFDEGHVTFIGPFENASAACHRYAQPGDTHLYPGAPAPIGDLNTEDSPCWQVIEVPKGERPAVSYIPVPPID